MKKHILIIDDSESIREVLSSGLELAGYSVTAAINGLDGLDRMRQQSFDMVITDLNMPQMDGISFLKEVRSQAASKYLPVILLTTESQEAKKQEAKNVGATGWITKPFSVDRVLEVIKKVIR